MKPYSKDLTADWMTMHRVTRKGMRAYSMDLREKIVESANKGVSKSETARRFGVDRATTVKRYCKRLDERGTSEPRRKAPG